MKFFLKLIFYVNLIGLVLGQGFSGKVLGQIPNQDRIQNPLAKFSSRQRSFNNLPQDVKELLRDETKIVHCTFMNEGNYQAMKLTFERYDKTLVSGIFKVDNVGEVVDFNLKKNSFDKILIDPENTSQEKEQVQEQKQEGDNEFEEVENGGFNFKKENKFQYDLPLVWSTQEIAASIFADIFGMTEVPYTTKISIDVEKLEKENPKVYNGDCFKVFLRHKKNYYFRKKIGKFYPAQLSGSVQHFVNNTTTLTNIQGGWKPNYQGPAKMRLFDFLTFNCDRPGNKNILIKKSEVHQEQLVNQSMGLDQNESFKKSNNLAINHIMIDNGFAFTDYDTLKRIRSDNDYAFYCENYFKLLTGPKEKLCSLVQYAGYQNEIQKLISIGENHLFEALNQLIPQKSFKEFWERILYLNDSCFEGVKNPIQNSPYCAETDLKANKPLEKIYPTIFMLVKSPAGPSLPPPAIIKQYQWLPR